MEGMEEGGQALKVNNGGERSPKMWLVQGGRRVFIGGENLAVGSKSRQSSAVGPAPPDFRPDGPADSPAVAKKPPVERFGGLPDFSGLGPDFLA
jgi:hypothetical protein